MEWHIIPTGRVWVDPGGSFGLVPRPLWLDHQLTDSKNRTPMDLNSLLIFSEGKTILVDTGLGHKLSEKALQNWGLEWPEGNLIENLANLGVSPEDVDLVINTHLHSDHCGGNTYFESVEVLPTFPKAEYWVQRMEFADAYHPDSRTSGTYLAENFIPVWQGGQYRMMHGDSWVTSQVKAVLTRGHTRGHQSLLLDEGKSPPVLFVSDMASYAVHFAKNSWVTAYDVEPLETIQTKSKWQQWASNNNAVLIFQHDTHIRKAHLIKNDRGKFEIVILEAGSIPK
jgi:glyoxylase-like metal-dependent hydrolase (beta-lactamase superfamily II)